MSLKYVPESLEQECRCGRLNTKVHCPRCGVYSVRARSQKLNDILQGVSLQTFACRTCGLIFNEQEWRERCMAPRSVKSERRFVDAPQSRHDTMVASLSNTDEIFEKANQYRVSKGMMPMTYEQFKDPNWEG